jgi:hypothetical protein
MSLRPSNLPKLAECACYEPNPNAGPAAARGSALDSLFRNRMAGLPPQPEMFYEPTQADWDAIEWSVITITALAGSSEVITREQECRVDIPGFKNGGTADAIIPAKLAHADLKTGQKRNYREQMAAYALGFMEQFFASEWTAHLLFCDQREVVTFRFTLEEAKRIVEQVTTKFNDPNKKPTPCVYCDWCAKETTCEARTGSVQTTLETVTAPEFNLAAVLADNAALGRFLSACAILDDYREKAEATAKERIQAGATIPGWKLASRKGSEFVDHVSVGMHLKELGFGAVLAAYGNLSAKKFREIWELKMPREKAFPEHLVKQGKATVSLRPDTATQSKA